MEDVTKDMVEDLLLSVRFGGDDDDFSCYFDISISIADGILINHKVCLSLDVFSTRSSEAEEGEDSNQECLAYQELHKETTFSSEVLFDQSVNIAQVVSDHLGGEKNCVFIQ